MRCETRSIEQVEQGREKAGKDADGLTASGNSLTESSLHDKIVGQTVLFQDLVR